MRQSDLQPPGGGVIQGSARVQLIRAGAPPGLCCPPPQPAGSHAGVHALAILLVLQPRLGQVNGEHAGDPDQAGDTAIDELGWQAAWVDGGQAASSAIGQQGGRAGWGEAGLGSDLICLSAI